MRIETERKMRRWREQRWILDQVIQTRGIDWDQGRTGKILRNCGPGVEADLQEICRRIQKFVDIPREFSSAPRGARNRAAPPKRPAICPRRANITISPPASIPTPCGRSTKTAIPQRIAWQERKRACYDKFIQHAGRPSSGSSCRTKAKRIQAILHLPPSRKASEKVPCIMYIRAWTGSKKTIRPAAIRSSSEASPCSPSMDPDRARRAKAVSLHRVELCRRRQARLRLLGQNARRSTPIGSASWARAWALTGRRAWSPKKSASRPAL